MQIITRSAHEPRTGFWLRQFASRLTTPRRVFDGIFGLSFPAWFFAIDIIGFLRAGRAPQVGLFLSMLAAFSLAGMAAATFAPMLRGAGAAVTSGTLWCGLALGIWGGSTVLAALWPLVFHFPPAALGLAIPFLISFSFFRQAIRLTCAIEPNRSLFFAGGKSLVANVAILAVLWGAAWVRSVGWSGLRTNHRWSLIDEDTGPHLTNDWSKFEALVAMDGRLFRLGMQEVAWSVGDGRWIQETERAPWGLRRDFGACSFKGRLWLLGGFLEGATWHNGRGDRPTSYRNDVWSSADGANWICHLKDAAWKPRFDSSVLVRDGELWLLGGRGLCNENECCPAGNFGDVWKSSDGLSWRQVTDRAPWEKLHSPRALALEGRVFVLGLPMGQGDGGPMASIWSSTDGIEWIPIPNEPPWRLAGDPWVWTDERNSFGVGVCDGALWVVGGFGFSSPPYGGLDMDEFGISTTCLAHWSDAWRSPDGKSWELVTGKSPWEGRSEPVLSALDGNLYVAGGSRGPNALDDVWVFEAEPGSR